MPAISAKTGGMKHWRLLSWHCHHGLHNKIRCWGWGESPSDAHKDTQLASGWNRSSCYCLSGETFPMWCYHPAALPSTHFLSKQNKRPGSLVCCLWNYWMEVWFFFSDVHSVSSFVLVRGYYFTPKIKREERKLKCGSTFFSLLCFTGLSVTH